MGRLAATIRWDIALQARNGFYLVTGMVLLFWAALLAQAPAFDARWLLPPLIMANLVLGSFYFMAAIVLLERAEGSLLARAATPLRGGEYLAARIASLSLLALVENLALAALVQRASFAALPMAGGVVLATALLSLAGLIMVARYGTINAFLLPSAAISGLLALPVVLMLAGWFGPLRYLHPLQAPLLLLEGAFRPLAAWELAYALLYGGLWTLLLGAAGLRAYRRLAVEAI